MAVQPSFRSMDASALTRQANQIWARIKQDVPSEFRNELDNIVQELTLRVDFVSNGKAPRGNTSYQSLQAAPLAQQARHVVTQIARNIPMDRRDSLVVFDALADRVEFAAIGYPSTAITGSSSGASPSRSRSGTTSRSRSRSSSSRSRSSSSRSRSSRARSSSSRSSSPRSTSSPSSSSSSSESSGSSSSPFGSRS